MIKKLILATCFMTFTTIASAERGDTIIDLAAGMGLNNDLPVNARLGMHFGFNEFTDIAFSAGVENEGDRTSFDLGVGSFYTHAIGDVSPQYGFSLGPRFHTINDEDTRGFYLKAHLRGLYEVSGTFQMYFEYSPDYEFGDNSGMTHSLLVGLRFK